VYSVPVRGEVRSGRDDVRLGDLLIHLHARRTGRRQNSAVAHDRSQTQQALESCGEGLTGTGSDPALRFEEVVLVRPVPPLFPRQECVRQTGCSSCM
jgi:hypothetical protein